MYHVILFDGTRIDNCLEFTTSDTIVHAGETYSDAVSILDVITPQNAKVVRVYNGDNLEVAHGGDLVLNPGGSLGESDGYKTCTVTLRAKTRDELLDEQISELQDAILEV